MEGPMQTSIASPRKTASLGAKLAAVAVSIALLSAGPVSADEVGAGVFRGYEYAPHSELTFFPTLCANFQPGTDPRGAEFPLKPPLEHVLDMTGMFHGAVGSGTAHYTNNANDYDANPEGTYAPGSDCLLETYAVPSTSMTINFAPYACSGDGLYERRGTSVYTLQFSGTCDNTVTGQTGIPTNVIFTGTQAPCDPENGCVGNRTASSDLDGDYVQTD